jgi:N-acetylglucosamine-6-phosphate deacetylase
MNMAVSRLSKYIEAPLEEAVRCATINPALLLGIGHETGSLRAGKRADIVVFDEDVKVKLTVLGGKVAYRGAL